MNCKIMIKLHLIKFALWLPTIFFAQKTDFIFGTKNCIVSQSVKLSHIAISLTFSLIIMYHHSYKNYTVARTVCSLHTVYIKNWIAKKLYVT